MQCGNGIEDPGEACDIGLGNDAPDVGVDTCRAGTTGTPICSADCRTINFGPPACVGSVDDECPADVQCPDTTVGIVTTFCNLNDENKAACRNMCAISSLCSATGSTSGYTVDINGDSNINGQDAFIILKIAEANVRNDCGSSAQSPCGPYSGTYTCDNGDFRVDGYKSYTYATTTCESFANTAMYITGGVSQS